MNKDSLEQRLQALEHSVNRGSKDNRSYLRPIVIGAVAFLLAGASAIVGISYLQRNPNQVALSEVQSNSSYQLFYPSKLPNDFFMLTSSVAQGSGVVQFTIKRDDGQTIQASEQSSGGSFDLSQVNGTMTNIPQVGTMVVGPGFPGYRAVINAAGTLIFMTSNNSISMADLTSIGKNLKPVGKPEDL